MMKIRFYRFAILVFFVLFFISESLTFARAKEIPSVEPFEKIDRVLILAPHPDDDIIGCAGVIQRTLKAGAKVKVVYMTCGDNNIFSILFYNKLLFPLKLILLREKDFITLGHQRVHEAVKAMKILGVKEGDLLFLGYPDHGVQEFI
ncbi:MAG: PIG-L family deacetylase [Candidatus Omnitrophica bacterium]|nr:PIG-L family deacetylase [Candidatus Omnitrophota bacterium]